MLYVYFSYIKEPVTAFPTRQGSNEYPQSMFWAEIYQGVFLSENF